MKSVGGSPPPPNMNHRSGSIQRNLGNATNGGDDKEKDSGKNGVNVKVIVRCRPLSDLERKDPSQFQVVSTKPEAKEVFVSQTIPGRKVESYSKTFTFDGVCNQYTIQQELFNTYIVPIVDEVLQGFNCTIFAYGQTGTGKTYTMEGDIYQRTALQQQRGNSSALLLPNDSQPLARLSSCTSASMGGGCPMMNNLTEQAGIIPRAVQHIFERLEAQDTEYSVRVSYLEIYNEELNDLLNDGDKQNLRIFEDSNGKKGLSVDRLEEIPVNNPQDIFNILSIAVKKRRTAETLLNRQSSRSHCIFSVMIHMKETNIDGEDVIKIGKLNLVDLAGSENIQRSGANTIKDRAKEAGMINQSLLTLGRVINALVEHSSYVPYRDSKLTRLLQESLGGRTKTCIVATISPSSLCLEETLSTLDYAFRAKNIRNRPEVNQKMTKRVMIRELNQEIERLKMELQANREKNGVYLPLDRFAELEGRITSQNVELTDATNEITKMRSDLTASNTEVARLREELAAETSAHAAARQALEATMHELASTRQTLHATTVELERETIVSSHLRAAEQLLHSRCEHLMDYITQMTRQLERLQEKLIGCRQLGKQQASVLEGLNSRGIDLKHSIGREVDQWREQWSVSLEEIGRIVIKVNRELGEKSKEELEEMVKSVEKIVRERLLEMNGLWESFERMLEQFDWRVNDCINKQVKMTEQNAEGLLKDARENVEALQLQLQEVSNLVASFSKDSCSITEVNKNAIGEFVNGMQRRVSGVGASLNECLTVNSSSLSMLMNRLSQFEQKQSESLGTSLETIQQQIALQLNELMMSQRGAMNAEIAQLVKTCQASKESIDVLKGASTEEMNEALPTEFSKFQNEFVSRLNAYDTLSSEMKQKHSIASEGVVNMVQGSRQLVMEWNEKQHHDNTEFVKTTLPTLLNDRGREVIRMGGKVKEYCENWKETTSRQSTKNREQIVSIFNQMANHMEGLETSLSQVNDTTQTHASQLEGSLEQLQSTSTSVQQSTNVLLNGLKTIGDTPRSIPLASELQTLPQLVPSREVLVNEWKHTQNLSTTATTTTTGRDDEMSDQDALMGTFTSVSSHDTTTNQSLSARTTTSSSLQTAPSLNTTALQQQSQHSEIPLQQPVTLPKVLMPPSSTRLVGRATSSSRAVGGSSRRSASLNRRRREGIPVNPLSTDSPSLRRASAGSQIGVGTGPCNTTVGIGRRGVEHIDTSTAVPMPRSTTSSVSGSCPISPQPPKEHVDDDEDLSMFASPEMSMTQHESDNTSGLLGATTTTNEKQDDLSKDRSTPQSTRSSPGSRAMRELGSGRSDQENTMPQSSGTLVNEDQQHRSPMKGDDEVLMRHEDMVEGGQQEQRGGFARPTSRVSQTSRRKHPATNERVPEGKRRRALSRDSRR